MTDRIEQIKNLLKKQPDDVFLHYSLGMEYAADGRFDEAVAAFVHCTELDSDYLAAYVEAGKCQRSAGHLAAAREIFLQAMELAQQQGQTHMADHVRQQLEGLK